MQQNERSNVAINVNNKTGVMENLYKNRII